MSYTDHTGTFYLGDCVETMQALPSASIDMAVTSPPYDNLRTYNDGDAFTWDVFCSVAKELTRVIKLGGVIVWNVADATINGSETGSSFRQALYFKDECGLNLHDTMIYQKSSQPKQNGYRYEQHFEYMFVFARGKPSAVNVLREPSKQAGRSTFRTSRDNNQEGLIRTDVKVADTKSRGNVWFYGSKENPTRHPAVFPVALAQDHILSWSNPGDVVLDPFGGSGTTAIAAINAGRRWICIERDETYYWRAVARVMDHHVKT